MRIRDVGIFVYVLGRSGMGRTRREGLEVILVGLCLVIWLVLGQIWGTNWEFVFQGLEWGGVGQEDMVWRRIPPRNEFQG